MKSRVLLLAIALVLAAFGAIAVLSYVNGADSRAVKGKRPVNVLVAKSLIPAGTMGARLRTGSLLEQVRMPAETVPPDALGSIDAGLDQLALTAELQPRQLVLRGMFGKPAGSTGGLSIPEGKLAVTVPVTVPGGVAGHVQPGTQVAIFDSYNLLEGKNVPAGDKLAEQHAYNRATKVLLPRIQVLSVGARKEQGAEDGKKKADNPSGDTMLVTVAVGQGEAEKLVHGTQTGSLYLALLTDSTDVRPGAGVDNYTLFR